MSAIPVFLASDDNYAPFVTTTMISILKNTKSLVHFYIMDNAISEKSKECICSLKDSYTNFVIEFIDMSKFDLNRFPDVNHYSVNTFSRYFIPELKPELSKVIYSDVDVIFCGDIAEYYAIDMDGYGIITVLEEIGNELNIPHNHSYRKKLFGLHEKHKYFEAGNIIIDCNYWREKDITQKLIDKTIELSGKLICPDLDVLNIIFECNYKKIHYKYCYCTHIIGNEGGNDEIIEAAKNPFIVHYTGKKPWNGQTPCEDYFWKMARLSPFYEEIRNRRNRVPVVQYHKRIRIFKKLTLLKIIYKEKIVLTKLFSFLPIWISKRKAVRY